MAAEEWIVILLWITLGAITGMLYVLRRIFLLEKKILNVEALILRSKKRNLEKKVRAKPKAKKSKKRRK